MRIDWLLIGAVFVGCHAGFIREDSYQVFFLLEKPQTCANTRAFGGRRERAWDGRRAESRETSDTDALVEERIQADAPPLIHPGSALKRKILNG